MQAAFTSGRSKRKITAEPKAILRHLARHFWLLHTSVVFSVPAVLPSGWPSGLCFSFSFICSPLWFSFCADPRRGRPLNYAVTPIHSIRMNGYTAVYEIALKVLRVCCLHRLSHLASKRG